MVRLTARIEPDTVMQLAMKEAFLITPQQHSIAMAVRMSAAKVQGLGKGLS